jgi:GNAT superfamily N-acetyltransferase
MRFARIIDNEDEMETIAKAADIAWLGDENDRLDLLQRYRNLIRRKRETNFQKGYVLMVCLDDQASGGFQFNGTTLVGLYDKEFSVSENRKMGTSTGYLEVFPQFRRNKYASFLLEHMITFLTLMGIEDLRFYHAAKEIGEALKNRGYKRQPSGYWSKV